MRALALLALLMVGGILAGCGNDTKQEALVQSQNQIDEANKKLEGGNTEAPAQQDP